MPFPNFTELLVLQTISAALESGFSAQEPLSSTTEHSLFAAFNYANNFPLEQAVLCFHSSSLVSFLMSREQ